MPPILNIVLFGFYNKSLHLTDRPADSFISKPYLGVLGFLKAIGLPRPQQYIQLLDCSKQAGINGTLLSGYNSYMAVWVWHGWATCYGENRAQDLDGVRSSRDTQREAKNTNIRAETNSPAAS